jgi:hypothetical protein
MSDIDSQDHKLRDFIVQHKYFWWWVPQNSLKNLSLNSIVEGTLNYGDIPDIKQLFNIVGIEVVAREFFNTINRGGRNNYFPITKNYFDLYFNQHVQEYSNKRASTTNTGN